MVERSCFLEKELENMHVSASSIETRTVSYFPQPFCLKFEQPNQHSNSSMFDVKRVGRVTYFIQILTRIY